MIQGKQIVNLVLTVLEIVAPVFLLAAIGFGWVKLGHEYRINFVTKLAMTLGTPALIFTALMDTEIEPSALTAISVAALAAYVAVAAVFFILLKLRGASVRSFLAPLTFGNTGNLGLPLALFALALSILLAFPAGLIAAATRGRAPDLGVMAFSQLGVAIPNFWFAMLLVLGTDRVVYKFYREQKAKPVILVIVSLGVTFIYNGITRFIIGADDQNFLDGQRFIMSARDFKEMTGLREGLAFKTTQGITIITAIIVVAVLFWFLNKTRAGKSMRAYSDNEDLALLSGINPERVVMITWLLVATLATIAGTLYGLDKTFKPFTYFQLLLPVFASAIVGGLGSPVGAIAGGFVIAFSEVGITYAWKKVAEYLLPEAWEPNSLLQLLGTDYKFAVSFVILVIVLLIRPTGLFKGKSV